MSVKTTRTLNPLHFEDLEPHRFEDLVRQLAYDLRPWNSIEAIGRSGADEGMDVRATEIVYEEDVGSLDMGELYRRPTGERLWIIQCKREKEIGPSRLRKIIDESLPQKRPIPHGFILAAACDLSKATRDAFREEMVARRVGEFYLWGKGELEDMVYLPKNDHLLFAHFGISIQVARRSMRSQLNSRLSVKKQLLGVTGGLGGRLGQGTWLFLLDLTEDRYPERNSIPDFAGSSRWGYYECIEHSPPNHLCFRVKRYFGYINEGDGTWDAMSAFDHQTGRPPQLRSHLNPDQEHDQKMQEFGEEWTKTTSLDVRCYVDALRFIHYDRILAVDPNGDVSNPAPHLLVEFDPAHGPFEAKTLWVATDEAGINVRTKLDHDKRVEFFQPHLRQ